MTDVDLSFADPSNCALTKWYSKQCVPQNQALTLVHLLLCAVDQRLKLTKTKSESVIMSFLL